MTEALKMVLELFTKTLKKLKKFEEENREILTRYSNLQIEKNEAEGNLRIIAQQEKEPVENDFVSVKIAQPYKKWYDYDIVWKISNAIERELIAQEATISQIDKEKFEKLVREGKIRKEVMQKSFKEEALTSRVLIKEK